MPYFNTQPHFAPLFPTILRAGKHEEQDAYPRDFPQMVDKWWVSWGKGEMGYIPHGDGIRSCDFARGTIEGGT